jgi:lipopolysaccharide export system permease protein
MSLFQLHMMKRLVLVAGLTSAACSLVVLFTTSLGMINLLSQGALSTGSFLLGMIALLPMILTVATPIGMASGVLYCYYSWIKQNEIMALRAAGASTISIALPGAVAGVAGMIFTGAMSLYFLPVGFRVFEDIRFRAVHNLSFSALHEGFNNLEPGLSLSYDKRLSLTVVENVIIIDERKPDALVVLTAERGEFSDLQANSPVLILENGERSSSSRSYGTSHTVSFDTAMVSLRSDNLGIRSWRGFFEEHVTQLLYPTRTIKENSTDITAWAAEAHRRIVSPFLSLGYVFFTVALLLNGREERIGGKFRPIAIFVGVIAWHCMMYLGHAAISRASEAVPEFYLFALLPAIAGICVLLWTDGRSRQRRAAAYRRLRSEN